MRAHLLIVFALELAASHTDSSTCMAERKFCEYHSLTCIGLPFEPLHTVSEVRIYSGKLENNAHYHCFMPVRINVASPVQ